MGDTSDCLLVTDVKRVHFDAGPGTFVKTDLMGRRCLYSVSGNLEEGGVKFTINFLSVCRE